ncbi:hypothetical protein NQ318_007977 [Aromia moschata]|uniref:DUF4817 domain-containing protein n=1 Tax=Aromia moschata TaxID=1265417 RepID=A0AAV8YBB5_9CUCU|nr:hypothetical protein NQ318_007977 [Aromia moschata]
MLTLEQRIYLIQCYGTGEECYRVVIKKFNEKYPEVSISNVGAKKLVTKFLETSSVLNIKKWLNEDVAASVLAFYYVIEAPRLSLRRRAIETEISKSHLQRIFNQIRMLPFKPKFRHTLEEEDEAKRLDFCLEMGNRVLNDFIAVFTTLAVSNALPSGHPLSAPINPFALSPIGPSGIVSGQGARGPSGIVTGTAAVGPSGIVTGLGPIGPTGPAGHGVVLGAPALPHAASGFPLAVPALGPVAPGLGPVAPILAQGPLGLVPPKLALGLGLGLGHGIHKW